MTVVSSLESPEEAVPSVVESRSRLPPVWLWYQFAAEEEEGEASKLRPT